MVYETNFEKFQRKSGLYAIKTFVVGVLLILMGIALTLILKNNWYVSISIIGLISVLWAISEGKPLENP